MRKIFHQASLLLIAGTAVSSLAISARAQTASTATATLPQTPATSNRTAIPERPRRPPRTGATAPAKVTVVADQTRVAPQVVTVVHRLSGVKMLRFLLRESEEPGTVYTIDPEDMANEAHASIIAGWALDDGKTIAVRLPQAGAEMEFARSASVSAGPRGAGSEVVTVRKFVTPGAPPDLTVITRDGRTLRARYVGLDVQTGLSVLQVNTVVMPPLAGSPAKDLIQGQDVQIFAPERMAQPGEASPRNIYVRVGELTTRILGLTSSAGKLDRLTVRGAGLTPSMIGGIACDQSGRTIGIVESIENGDARIVSADRIRAAAGRVLERQASVPRPLLGVVGEPVEFANRSAFLANGWREDQLPELLEKSMGILLTAVRPGTPADLAKLRAGDVIVRINQDDVQNGEAFSKLLGEAGSGRDVQFLIRRPGAPKPLPIDVKLGGSFDQAFKYHFEFPAIPPMFGAFQVLGVETMPLSAKNLAQLGAQSGVLVVAVEPESIAARSGLKEGDVIESIDGQVVKRGAWAVGFEFSRRKKHFVSLVRKREKKQVVLEPVE